MTLISSGNQILLKGTSDTNPSSTVVNELYNQTLTTGNDPLLSMYQLVNFTAVNTWNGDMYGFNSTASNFSGSYIHGAWPMNASTATGQARRYTSTSAYGSLGATTYTDNSSTTRTIRILTWGLPDGAPVPNNGNRVFCFALSGSSVTNSDDTFEKLEIITNGGTTVTINRTDLAYDSNEAGNSWWEWHGSSGTMYNNVGSLGTPTANTSYTVKIISGTTTTTLNTGISEEMSGGVDTDPINFSDYYKDGTYHATTGIPTSGEIKFSDFYGKTRATLQQLAYTNNRRTFSIIESVEDSDSTARAYVWCYRTGTTIKIYARLQGIGDAAGASADASIFTGLGETGTETSLTAASSFHNVNFEFAEITNVDSGYKVGFTDAAVTGQNPQHASGEVTSQNMTNSSSPTTTVSTTFWTASAGSSTQDTPPAGINYVRYESDAVVDNSDVGYDRVTLHFTHATLPAFDVVVDISTEAEGILVDPGEEDCPQCCIHESMLIATEEDMKSIHDIKIGDKVISYNFETQSNELVEVEDLITIERDVDYKVNNLILTEDHPVYLNTGKKASINPEATLLNYKQEVDQIQTGDIMVKLDGTEEVIESIEKYEGTHLNYAIKTKHNNFYADGILVDSVILEKK